MIFGDFMLGARSRLLPISVPFPFFAAAVLFQIAGWGLLAAFADEAPGFSGGPGQILASLHLVTLGVGLMTAMGALFQILPVVTGRPLRSVTVCRVIFGLFFPGVLALTHGMGHQQVWVMEAGAALTVAAILLFLAQAAAGLRHAGDLGVVTEHVEIALACLLFLALLGLSLVADLDRGFLWDHAAVARVHSVVSAYGFMGLLAAGMSFILIPMFGLARPADERTGRYAAWAMIAGVALAVTGLLADENRILFPGAIVGLAGLVLHLSVMVEVMRTLMEKADGPSFLLIRLGWGMMPASILVGVTAAAGVAVDRTGPLFGFILIFGWMLSFVMGVLQRILPFLGAMHTVGGVRRPLAQSDLTVSSALWLHFAGHVAGLLLAGAGLVLQSGLLVRLGALAGLTGALAFAGFFLVLCARLWRHLRVPA